MNLEQIYEPITEELKSVEGVLESSIGESKDASILQMARFLLESRGKRVRPALVILSAKASLAGQKGSCNRDELVKIAAAAELIHMASLIHDDVIDKASERHNKTSVNFKWGDDVAVALGDYIYSEAFELIGRCKNPDVFLCISQAMRLTCQGELLQVCQRDNFDLSKETYILIIKEKTASFFAACCHAGTILSGRGPAIQTALKEYGLNFGMAFQIVDDCKDIICVESLLGKQPGQDVSVGEITLPLLNLFDAGSQTEKTELRNLLRSKGKNSLSRIRKMFIDSNALRKTTDAALSYVSRAKERLDALDNSDYKESLRCLADYVVQRDF